MSRDLQVAALLIFLSVALPAAAIWWDLHRERRYRAREAAMRRPPSSQGWNHHWNPDHTNAPTQ